MFAFLKRQPTPALPAHDHKSFSSIATVEDIRACFRLLLGRDPNSEEWPGHSARAGEDLTTVVRLFLHAKQFHDRRLMDDSAHGAYEFVRVDGQLVAASPDDIDVGKNLLRNGEHEPHVTSVFRRELKNGMRVVDIGANIGYFSFLALACVGQQGYVWAVEPNLKNVRLLEISKRKNASSNLTIIPAAAGDILGTVKLNAAYSNGMVSKLTTAVEDLSSGTLACQIELDSIFSQSDQVDFIKIDVEGAEYIALKGLECTIGRCNPKIVSEFSPSTMPGISGITGKGYLEFLFQKGYQIGMISPDGSVRQYHRSVAPIFEMYEKGGSDHVDIFAVPTQ